MERFSKLLALLGDLHIAQIDFSCSCVLQPHSTSEGWSRLSFWSVGLECRGGKVYFDKWWKSSNFGAYFSCRSFVQSEKIKVLGQFELYILIISYEIFMWINRKVATLFLTSSQMPPIPFQLPGSYHQPIISQSRSMDFSKTVKSVWARLCCHDK